MACQRVVRSLFVRCSVVVQSNTEQRLNNREPAQDYDFLYKAGVAAIFGPGTPVAHSAKVVMELLMGK